MLLAPVLSKRASWALLAVVALAVLLSIQQKKLLISVGSPSKYGAYPHNPFNHQTQESVQVERTRESDANERAPVSVLSEQRRESVSHERTRKSNLAAAHDDASLDNIFNSTLGFEKILVVSLPTRTDRRDGLALQAALSHMSLEFIDGVQGAAVVEKAIPKAENDQHILGAELGSWRGHINAIHEVIRQNLSSALIMEDDGDWDVRLKDQLTNFALASRALTQPLANRPGQYADPTYPRRPSGFSNTQPDISFERLPVTEPPKTSPYGDDWDVLWIGHCGQAFAVDDNPVLPRGRVIHKDWTIPPKEHLDSPHIQPYTLKDKYPDFTRAVHHSQFGVCSLAYAVSQRGARRLMLELGLKPLNAPFDLMLRAYCQGDIDRGGNKCLTTQPSLINHHRLPGPIKAESDIKKDEELPEGYRAKGETAWIQRPVRLNAAALLYGATELPDQYPTGDREPPEEVFKKEDSEKNKDEPSPEKKEEPSAVEKNPAENNINDAGEKPRKIFTPQKPAEIEQR